MPVDGAIVRGAVDLAAEASSDYPITSVDFQISSSGGQQVKLVHAFRFPYGWLAGWSTINLPNGRYTVQSIVRIVTGHSSTSQAVTVTVENLGPELAQSFKAPHHGSQNGWHEDVWTKMLDQNPVTIVAPWSLGANFRRCLTTEPGSAQCVPRLTSLHPLDDVSHAKLTRQSTNSCLMKRPGGTGTVAMLVV